MVRELTMRPEESASLPVDGSVPHVVLPCDGAEGAAASGHEATQGTLHRPNAGWRADHNNQPLQPRVLRQFHPQILSSFEQKTYSLRRGQQSRCVGDLLGGCPSAIADPVDTHIRFESSGIRNRFTSIQTLLRFNPLFRFHHAFRFQKIL